MKNMINIFICFAISTLVMSCPNPSAVYPESVNWFFVNQTEVDKLLKSPETIEFEGKKYKLTIKFDNDLTRGRPCVFICFPPSIERERRFRFFIEYNDINITENNKIKATNLWIINTNKKFYFKANNLSSSDTLSGIVNAPKNYTFTLNNNEILEDSGVAIMRFETKEKEYFIKTNKIMRGEQL